jgi:dihydropyrimidinase
MKYLIQNGVIVTPADTFKADVVVGNGVIQAIGAQLSEKGEDLQAIDASGKYLLPGAIDVHTHMALPFGGTVSSDDFADGTAAAAFGGVTTIIDFAIQAKGESLAETVSKRRALADGLVYIDYGLHVSITDFTPAALEEMVDIIKAGCPTFKLFMVYPDWAADDYTLLNAIRKASKNNGMIGVHAENLNLVTRNVAELLAAGHIEPKYHEMSRPDYVEAEAVGRAIMWAQEGEGKLYFVHLSTAKGLEKIRQAQRQGYPIMCETCPQYLLLTKEKYLEPGFNGAKYVMSPPLRSDGDREALWKGLAGGEIRVVGSDHCPFSMDQKKLGIDSFAKIPNGAPGVETTLMLLHSEGVLKGRITLEKMVEVTSQNPAKIFGLGRKGAIEVGKDADLVIFDPNLRKRLSHTTLHTKNDYSPYEGLEVTGAPVLTMARGAIVCDNGKLTGSKGWGRFVERRL